ncbi:hypothetical protein BafACA1_I01 (plasmid) [Borreliella afzelii ACA-1]|nr:hypothetical protein BafACA1_D28 [Borreliella afzelii ACA-1]ACJ73348.1 hypothetical protein BafACA1_AA36 [Borreliella afzelii ACA-1]ACJ73668.1 hypothetical protein BafACA1_I01 [Borreliella afzelii ACA-1]
MLVFTWRLRFYGFKIHKKKIYKTTKVNLFLTKNYGYTLQYL